VDYSAQVERIDQELTHHLRIRSLQDPDNQRLLLHASLFVHGAGGSRRLALR
jgi:hypothetical protein